MQMRWTRAAGAVLVTALAACTGKQHGAPAISRERFVLANADLRSVPDTAPRGDSLRAAALRRYRVSEADLRRFVVVHGGDADYMAAVWRDVADSVQKRYDRTFPLVHPTHEAPTMPPNQPPNLVPAAPGRPMGQQPPPTGVPPRSPQRPRPPKLPEHGPRLVPQGNRPPPTPPPAPSPADTLRDER
jgi:hypothetical protein